MNSRQFFLVVAPLFLCQFIVEPDDALAASKATLTGLDIVVQSNFESFNGMTVGIITNQTGVNRNGDHIIDLLHQAPGVQVRAIFSPEHGLRGLVEGGENILNQVDQKTGIPIYGLYGQTDRPTPQMLTGLDALIFDIQDIGTRFYTYISTMSKAMAAAGAIGIPFYVLDRPNPIGGIIVEGPVLDIEYRSFVGIHPIALRHGMTVGELARMFNEEGWLEQGCHIDLSVIAMKNWQRNFFFDNTGLEWIKPSPNMPTLMTALLYPGMGLLEATNLSEGRGTQNPFERIGAPWIDSKKLTATLAQFPLEGISFIPDQFTPVDLAGMAMNPKFENTTCQGLHLTVTNPAKFLSVEFAFYLISAICKLYPDQFRINDERMNKMAGIPGVNNQLFLATEPSNILASWNKDLDIFKEKRKKYLIYQ